MLRWEEEKEQFYNWWSETTTREIVFYFLCAFFLMCFILQYYYYLGISGSNNWYRFMRNAAECLILIFLTELTTGKSLLHPFWRIGYIPFFAWTLIFPYVLIHARNGISAAKLNHLSPYFLTSVASLLFIFFVMNVISKVVVGRKLAAFICLIPIAFFSFNAFVFLTHYTYMGIMMSPREMFFATYDPIRWFSRIVLPHIGGLRLAFMGLGILAYLVLYYRWIYRSAYRLHTRWIRKSNAHSLIHRILQFLVFIGCAWLLIRWVSECFPLHDYEIVKQYKSYIDFVNGTRF